MGGCHGLLRTQPRCMSDPYLPPRDSPLVASPPLNHVHDEATLEHTVRSSFKVRLWQHLQKRGFTVNDDLSDPWTVWVASEHIVYSICLRYVPYQKLVVLDPSKLVLF